MNYVGAWARVSRFEALPEVDTVPVAEAVPLAPLEHFLTLVEGMVRERIVIPCFSPLIPLPKIYNYIVVAVIFAHRHSLV
jgi:hypothetical protein